MFLASQPLLAGRRILTFPRPPPPQPISPKSETWRLGELSLAYHATAPASQAILFHSLSLLYKVLTSNIY